MSQTKIIALLLFIAIFQTASYSQTEKISNKQLEKQLVDSGNYLYKLEYNKSLLTANKVLVEALKNDKPVLAAKAYNIIGLNFAEFSDSKKTIQFYNKALYYANLTTNDSIKDWIYNNLGTIYTQEKIDFNKGIEYYKKGLVFSNRLGDANEIVATKLNIAGAYFEIKDFDNGIQYLNPIRDYIVKKGDYESKIILYSLYGSYFNHLNKIDSSIISFKKAIDYRQLIKDEMIDFEIISSYQELSNIYEKKGDYKKALEYLNLRNELNNVYNNQERTKKAKIIGSQIEIDDYKRRIDKIEFEKELQKRSLIKSRIVVGLFIVIFVILVLLLNTLNKTINFKKRTNEELVKINDDLKIAKEKAEEASLLKTQFVSTISHELRTPLYGVVGITNMLLDEHKELADSPHLNSLKFSARYLLSLVNDILQINKIEEKRIILESLTFNVPDELNIVTNSLQFIANKNENTVTIDVDEAIPEFLIGDKLRLSQIIMNLVSNALKFTKKGDVHISVKLTKVVAKLHYLEFQIEDNGIGIAESDQDKIYDKFVQVGRKEDDYQGTGLGLSIVKKLIELFDSEIYITSQLNTGTTFKFTIAFEADFIKTKEIINNIEVDLTSSYILKVLVVEDNKINQIVTRKIIEKNNFKCDVVEDGIQALEILEKETYDIILMDINMPIINGFETTRRIRKKGIITPIVALTAFDKEEIAEEAISSGMNDIIIKPFEPLKLFQIINSQIVKNKTTTNSTV